MSSLEGPKYLLLMECSAGESVSVTSSSNILHTRVCMNRLSQLLDSHIKDSRGVIYSPRLSFSPSDYVDFKKETQLLSVGNGHSTIEIKEKLDRVLALRERKNTFHCVGTCFSDLNQEHGSHKPVEQRLEGLQFLSSLFDRRLSVLISDGRKFIGYFKGVDRQSNIILNQTEQRMVTPNCDQWQCDWIGLVVIPGQFIKCIWKEEIDTLDQGIQHISLD
jgi:small nuclear ribonucleoprotein (snRNP)-like protein